MGSNPTARIEVTGAEAIITALQRNNVPRKEIEDAVKRGASITLEELRRLTPEGPSGNLKRAVAIKSVTYESGTVVAVVGYRRAGRGGSASAGGKVRAGPDRAFHQYWIEYGTATRKLKNGAIASSLKSFGPEGSPYFEERGYGKKSGWSGPVVIYRPKDGIIGAVKGQGMMQRAYERTKDAARAAIEQEVALALTAALKKGA